MVLFVHCISGLGTTVHYNLWFISENHTVLPVGDVHAYPTLVALCIISENP